MRVLNIVLAVIVAVGLSACGSDSKFKRYNGPEVTSVQVHKSARRMYLLHGNKVLEAYDIALGFQPLGHKEFEGDGKTPEGGYYIDRRNPNSQYHLSIGVSYPNLNDQINAPSRRGKSPGGDIFIHGRSNYNGTNRGDWTAGCIAVEDEEMEDVYAMVKDGTPIHILP